MKQACPQSESKPRPNTPQALAFLIVAISGEGCQSCRTGQEAQPSDVPVGIIFYLLCFAFIIFDFFLLVFLCSWYH